MVCEQLSQQMQVVEDKAEVSTRSEVFAHRRGVVRQMRHSRVAYIGAQTLREFTELGTDLGIPEAMAVEAVEVSGHRVPYEENANEA